MIASFVLGLLGVSHALGFAVVEACIATLGYIVVDGQGAFMGPIMFALVPFWPLIGLGKLIRSLFRR